MRENLHRFFRAARGAGVKVSPAESIDAMRAVASVGLSDRGILRDTLLLTLAKTEDEKQALSECFDLFFKIPEPAQSSQGAAESDGGSEASEQAELRDTADTSEPSTEGLGPLAQMLLSQDRSAISAAIADASNAASLSNIRYFTQRGLYASRILDFLGIQRLRDDLDALTVTNPANAERLAAATEALRENVREVVSQALLLYGRIPPTQLRLRLWFEDRRLRSLAKGAS